MVAELVTELIRRWPQVATIEFAVEDVPPSNPAPWESHNVVVARIFPADRRRGLHDRIVVSADTAVGRMTTTWNVGTEGISAVSGAIRTTN